MWDHDNVLWVRIAAQESIFAVTKSAAIWRPRHSALLHRAVGENSETLIQDSMSERKVSKDRCAIRMGQTLTLTLMSPHALFALYYLCKSNRLSLAALQAHRSLCIAQKCAGTGTRGSLPANAPDMMHLSLLVPDALEPLPDVFEVVLLLS